MQTPPRSAAKQEANFNRKMAKRKSTKSHGKGKKKSKRSSSGRDVPLASTYQHDRTTEYKSKKLTKKAKREKKFSKKVYTALQKKMPPNYMLFTSNFSNFNVPSGKQGVL